METKKNNSEYIPEFEKILSLSAVLGRLVGRCGNGGDRINAGIIP